MTRRAGEGAIGSTGGMIATLSFKPIEHHFTRREIYALRNLRMAHKDPILGPRLRKKQCLSAVKSITKKNKAKVSLAPLSWGE